MDLQSLGAEYHTECYQFIKNSSDRTFTNLNKYIPKPLSYLLSEIILNDKESKRENISDYENKCESIAHVIIVAVRPRSFLSTLQKYLIL